MIAELLSSIVLATNVSGCVMPTSSYVQESSNSYTPQITESRNNQNVDDTEYRAVRLSPSNFSELDSYQFSFSSELYGRLGNTDYDYYYISVLCDSVFTFTVSNDGELPFWYSVYRYTNQSQDSEYVYSYSDLLINEEIEDYYEDSIVLQPGTYYVVFDGLGNDLNGELVASYSISGVIRKNVPTYSVDLAEAKFGKKLKGVYWESDCLPIDFDSTSNSTDITYYQWNKNSCNSPKYNLDDLREISNGNKIRYKTYYLFDVDTIKSIKEYLLLLKNNLEVVIRNDIQNLNDIQLSYQYVDGANSIVSSIIDMTGNSILSFRYKLTSTIIDFIFDCVVDNVIDNLVSNVLTLIDLSNVIDTLNDKLIEIIEYNLKDYTSDHPAQWKGLEISLFYSLMKENVNIGYPKHYVYTSYNYNELNVFSVYANSKISSTFPDLYGTSGRFYAISNDNVMDYSESPQSQLEERDLIIDDTVSTYDKLIYGSSLLLKFTPSSSKTYHFYFYSEVVMDDPKVDIFFVKPLGYDNSNRIATYKGKYINPSDSSKHGTYFQKYLNSGETFYIRITIQEVVKVESYALVYDVLENELENAYHEHNYNSYSYINGSQHRASCSCGDSYLEYHSVRSNSRMCMYCRGIVDKGIIDIPFRLLDRSIEGYYVHESGVKVYE